MTEMSSQSAIFRVLDHLRNEPLPLHYMGVALAALIYLRWADFQEAEQEAIAAFDDADYKPVLPAFLHWRSWHSLPPQEVQVLFMDRLYHALEGMNNFRHSSLATHLHRAAPAVRELGRLSPRSLDALIRWLADQPFETPSDRRALLDILDAALDKASGKHSESGQYRTPDAVVQLLIEIASPAAGERVYDPCFGSAGLLTASCDHVLKQKDRFGRSSAPDLTISGIEINPNAYLIGLTRLALAGVADPQIELGNSLERMPPNNPQRDGYDVVLTNPPWGWKAQQSKEYRWGLRHFSFLTNEGSGLFVQHALQQLRPHGRAVIVVPEGLLFRRGVDQQLRQFLVENHTVEAVVSLPDTIFMPYTMIKANILVLRRGGSTKRVRMMDAKSIFETGKGRQPATISDAIAEEVGGLLRSVQPGQHCWDIDPKSLAEVDWDFTPKRRDQSGLMGILDSLRSEVDVVPLKECGHILTGRSIRSSDLVDAPEAESPIPYIRIKDVQRGQATKGSSWLAKDAAASIDARWKLRAGDVLLSKSGTIGKAGVVRNGAVGAVAANGLFVLRPDQNRLDSHFLAAYLDSSECRAWLDDKARGATVRHINKGVLDEMPIPLAPLQIQHRVATEYREYSVDVLTLLTQLLTQREDDPIPTWIIHALAHLKSEKGKAFSVGDIEPLFRSQVFDFLSDRFLFRNLRKGAREDVLTLWFLTLRKAVDTLHHFDDVPPGPASYSLLQQALASLQEAERSITGNLPNEKNAQELTRAISDRVSKAMEALASDVRVSVFANTNTLWNGESSNITLTMVNQAMLPFRDFRVWTTPDWGNVQIGYLAEGGRADFNVSGMPPGGGEKFSLRVQWSGLSMNGTEFRSQREISFDVVDPSEVGEKQSAVLGGSPYITGDPVKPERNDVFFGRDELLERIRQQIIHSGNVVLLEGNRRTGKSSILWHLEGPTAIPKWLGVYCSLQGTEGSKESEGIPTVEVFRGIAYSIVESLMKLDGEAPLPDGTILRAGTFGIVKAVERGIRQEKPFSDFREYIGVVLNRLSSHDLGLLLMLDEFDKLQDGIDNGVTSPQVPENIRFLIHQYSRLSAILTGSHVISRLRDEYWSALFGLSGLEVKVSFLPEGAARQLILDPIQGRLTYSNEAVMSIIYLTAGHPYLIQCLCNHIFGLASRLKTRSVTLDLVEKAVDLLIEGKYFGSFWEFAGTHRRRLILALAHRESSGIDDFRFGVIQERLLENGIEVDDDILIADLTKLRELELIKLVGEPSGGRYVLAIPMMGMWIEKQQDFAAIVINARSETEDERG